MAFVCKRKRYCGQDTVLVGRYTVGSETCSVLWFVDDVCRVSTATLQSTCQPIYSGCPMVFRWLVTTSFRFFSSFSHAFCRFFWNFHQNLCKIYCRQSKMHNIHWMFRSYHVRSCTDLRNYRDVHTDESNGISNISRSVATVAMSTANVNCIVNKATLVFDINISKTNYSLPGKTKKNTGEKGVTTLFDSRNIRNFRVFSDFGGFYLKCVFISVKNMAKRVKKFFMLHLMVCVWKQFTKCPFFTGSSFMQ